MPRLLETQTLFWRLITAPEGVAHGLESLPDRAAALPGGLDGVIRGDERLSAVERLDVYANMYFFRILDILRDDFAAVVAVVGDVRFHNLVTDYLLAHPSTHPSVRYLGRHLPGFLEGHASSREHPWLPDLARLEWAILEAFDGPDAEAVTSDCLQEVSAEDWAGVRFGLAPTLQVLRSRAPVNRIWAAVSDGATPPEIPLDATAIRVWRKELRVLHRPVDAAEGAAIDAVLAGEDFGGVCEAVAAVEGAASAPERAARVLHGWFADGLVTAVHPPARR